MLELDTAAQCTSKAASKPAGSVKSGDVSHSFAAFQSLPTRIAWNATINSLPTSAVVIHVPILVRSGEGYGKLLKVDFHDSACDSHLGTNEQVDGPVRRDRYLD